ncbi:MAG: hypothetical protein H7210_05390 [Pyrinomonadaceae bacterium]|nr:hypothetical protein [Phycisphaerales bacterium]
MPKTSSFKAIALQSPRLALLTLLAATGCSVIAPAPTTTISAADFASKPGDTDVKVVPPPEKSTRTTSSPAISRPGDAVTAVDVSQVIGPPPPPQPLDLRATPTPAPASESLVLDSLVGQINGNPVYASKFFRDTNLDASLAGKVNLLKNDAKWKAEAREDIRRALLDKVRDELVLAEARASLTPDQRKGLFYFIAQLREDLISGAGGSEATVDENLREREGKGIDEKVKEDLDTKLVQREIYQRVASKINVSWKDVQLEYDRREAEFNPAPKAVLRMVWLPADKPELIEQFTSRIAAAGSTPGAFKDVASTDGNLFNSGQGGIAERTFRKDAYASGDFFPAKELNDAARQLSVGGTVGPIETVGANTNLKRVAWIHLDSIETPPPRTLYDVQLALTRELRERRFKEESQKYLEKILNQGSFSDVKDMTDKLVAIASDRFLITQRP